MKLYICHCENNGQGIVLLPYILWTNRDNPEFLVQFEERINEVCSENIVVGGDWN